MRYISILIFHLILITTAFAQNRNSITTQYDELGRIKQEVYYDSLRVRYQYDATGNRLSRTIECLRLQQSQRRDTICEGDTFRIAQNRYLVTGNYRDTFRFTTKCDSVVQTNLFVKRIERTRLDTSICSGDSLYIAKQLYTIPNTYRDTFPSFTEGVCFSVQTTQLTVNPVFQRDISVCKDSSYTFYNQVLRNAGIYSKRFTSARGCDSIVKVNLRVITPSRRVFDTTVCSGYPLELGTTLFYNAGIDSVTLRSKLGCDSMKLVFNLRFQTPILRDTIITICSGDSVQFGNRFLKQANIYTEKFNSGIRCNSTTWLDSTVRLDLRVTPRPQSASFEMATCGRNNGRIWTSEPDVKIRWNNQVDTAFSNLTVGTYPITIEKDACAIRDTVKIILASPAVKVLVNTNSNGSVTAIGNIGTPPYRFRWSDSLSVTSETRTRLPRGNFTVTVTDSKGCQDSLRFFYNASQEINGLSQFNISPNPTNGILVVNGQFETVTPFECQLITVSGQTIWQYLLCNAADFKFNIDISNRANGEYFFILKSKGRSNSYPILLQH